jgi:S-adenosylmethionine hydrolase
MKDNLNYLFTINHGEPSYDNIQAYTDKENMVAGETVRVTVDVTDKYFNPITETQAKSVLKLQYKNADGSTVSLDWTGSQDGKLWTDAQITTSGLKEFSVVYKNEQAVACKNCNV